jgi:hypothetical protein
MPLAQNHAALQDMVAAWRTGHASSPWRKDTSTAEDNAAELQAIGDAWRGRLVGPWLVEDQAHPGLWLLSLLGGLIRFTGTEDPAHPGLWLSGPSPVVS